MGRRKGSGSLEKVGDSFYYRVTLADGTRPRFRLAARDAATAEHEIGRLWGWMPTGENVCKADQLRALIELGDWARAELEKINAAGEAAADVPLSSVWEMYTKKSTAAAGSIVNYKRTFDNLLSFCKAKGIESAADVSGEIVAAWVKSGPPARAIKYISTVWKKCGFSPAVFAKFAEVTPEAGEQYRRIEAKEAQTVLEALESDGGEWSRIAADMLVVGWYTGLRITDVGRIRTEIFDREARALRIVPKKTKKIKPHPLFIPLVGAAFDVVENRLSKSSEAFPGAVSVLADGREITRSEVHKALQAAFSKLKPVEGFRTSFHSLRASFITAMDEAGVQVALTDAITGHAAQTMHGHYSQPAAEALRAAVEKAIKPLVRNNPGAKKAM